MKRMESEDYRLLGKLLRMKQNEVHKHVYGKLLYEFEYKKVIDGKDYIMAQGDLPIILLAHMDTVMEQMANAYEMIYDPLKGIITGLYGVGMDDKAGIAAIFNLLRKGYRPHVIFCHDEECGGVGSRQLVVDYKMCPLAPFPKYMVQIDRRGLDDCVFYDNDNKEFIKYIESFGFKEDWGSFTDICNIGPEWDIASVNLSTAYFNEHTNNEYLFVPGWYKTIDRIEEMLKSIREAKSYEHVETLYYNYGYPYEPSRYYYGGEEFYNQDLDYCDGCEKTFEITQLIDVILKDGNYGLLCPDCFAEQADLCAKCGEFYQKDKDDIGLCSWCDTRKELKYVKLPKTKCPSAI